MENSLPFWSSPSIKCLQSQVYIQRFVILSSYNLVQVVASRVHAGAWLAVDAGNVRITTLCEVVGGANAESTTVLVSLLLHDLLQKEGLRSDYEDA